MIYPVSVPSDDGQAVVTTWEGRRLPYRLTRLARVNRNGAVIMTYHAVNDSAALLYEARMQ